jgi:hypothetical protein
MQDLYEIQQAYLYRFRVFYTMKINDNIVPYIMVDLFLDTYNGQLVMNDLGLKKYLKKEKLLKNISLRVDN